MSPSSSRRPKVAIFGTHPKQFNGYSKVVYELCKAMRLAYPWIEMHVFGFQNFYNHPAHRMDLSPDVKVYDANAEEVPKAAGFGVSLVKGYVARVRPDVIVIFNDLMVLTSVLNEVKDAPNRKEFKVIAYVDQVYLSQRKDFIEFVNLHADAVMAFTPDWKDCIVWQGIRLPTYFLPHGINTDTYFPVPRTLARRFYGLSDDDFLILNLNRNQPRKRWDICMQAFAEVVRRMPDAPIKLVIGTDTKGSWDLKELFERELRKRGVSLELGMSRLVIPGHPQMLTDEETNVLYNVADVGINTCDGEGFGLCNFEQAAIGIPQIVPRIGGFKYVFDPSFVSFVDPRVSLYVDSTRDGVGGEAQLSYPEDYADAIIRYYTRREMAQEHGRTGRAAILSRFGWDKIATHFVDILKAVHPSAIVDGIGSSELDQSLHQSSSTKSSVIDVADIERMLVNDVAADADPATSQEGGTLPQCHSPIPEDETTSHTSNDDIEELKRLRERIDTILARRARQAGAAANVNANGPLR